MLLQLHLYTPLNTCCKWIGWRQQQDKTRNILSVGIWWDLPYIRDLTMHSGHMLMHAFCYFITVYLNPFFPLHKHFIFQMKSWKQIFGLNWSLLRFLLLHQLCHSGMFFRFFEGWRSLLDVCLRLIMLRGFTSEATYDWENDLRESTQHGLLS